jgi:RHS repeat-associated protein
MTGETLEYVHQDHLSGMALVSDGSGYLVSEISYYPYGSTRSGDVPTDKKFTGQRLDGTGLYYYGARYYDPVIGRFISADIIVQNPANPQTLNRYSYCLNNPLK